MPVLLRLVLGSLLVLAGVVLIAVAVLGARSRLQRNRWIGVRTPATLRTDTAFRAGNRAAAVPLGAAGVVAAVGGLVLLGGAGGAVGWVVLAVSVVGTLGMGGVGGMVGDRVARAEVPLEPTSVACAGACAGCDLVAGCRPAGAAAASGPAAADQP